jgi:hypothetical protein
MVQEVLGHKILEKGIEVDKVKVEFIEQLPSCSNVKGICCFLGHVGFYRRFIQNFSQIARPLTRLLAKDASFFFTEECLQSCHTLKKALFGSVRLYTTFLGVPNPRDRQSVVMLTARVPDGPDPVWRSPLLPA